MEQLDSSTFGIMREIQALINTTKAFYPLKDVKLDIEKDKATLRITLSRRAARKYPNILTNAIDQLHKSISRILAKEVELSITTE